MTFAIEFEPRDFWLGLYWNRKPVVEAVPIDGDAGLVYLNHKEPRVRTDVYICVIPFVPLHFSWMENHHP